ncbi:MAG TPA: DUF742 domain-containing protein [Actinocatenispora sp.]
MSSPVDPRQDPRGHLVRPYAMTAGRTEARRDLALESMVRSTRKGVRAAPAVGRDRRIILDLCTDGYQSVAEIAAQLGRPLGVTRVLLSELAEMGLVDIEESAHMAGGEVSVALLERVLSGLHKL